MGTFTVPFRSGPRSGTERGCVRTGTEKIQAVRSKTGPEIGWYVVSLVVQSGVVLDNYTGCRKNCGF